MGMSRPRALALIASPIAVTAAAAGTLFALLDDDGDFLDQPDLVEIESGDEWHLFVADDYWISIFLRTKGIPVISLGPTLRPGDLVWTRTHEDHQLSRLEGDLRRGRALREGTRFLIGRRLLSPRWRLACALTYAESVLRAAGRRLASGRGAAPPGGRP